MLLFDLVDEGVLRSSAQFAYDSIVGDFRAYKDDDRATFIVATVFESPDDYIDGDRLDAIIGADTLANRIVRLRQIADEFDQTLEIDEFPGYTDYWTAFKIMQGDLVFVLHVGTPDFAYYYIEESAEDYQSVPFISDFKAILPPQEIAPVLDPESVSRVWIQHENGEMASIIRDDGLPFTIQEMDQLSEYTRREV